MLCVCEDAPNKHVRVDKHVRIDATINLARAYDCVLVCEDHISHDGKKSVNFRALPPLPGLIISRLSPLTPLFLVSRLVSHFSLLSAPLSPSQSVIADRVPHGGGARPLRLRPARAPLHIAYSNSSGSPHGLLM